LDLESNAVSGKKRLYTTHPQLDHKVALDSILQGARLKLSLRATSKSFLFLIKTFTSHESLTLQGSLSRKMIKMKQYKKTNGRLSNNQGLFFSIILEG